jgi:hypothetical protein
VGLPNPSAPYINYRNVTRVHEDDSVLWRYYDVADSAGLSKMALSLSVDIGCEYGGGVHCSHGPNKANFFGAMAYNRLWFDHNVFAVTAGGGFMNNPGRYLALLPPINGATAATGTPYFTENPGQKLYQWDLQLNLQYMPKDWITWWTEAPSATRTCRTGAGRAVSLRRPATPAPRRAWYATTAASSAPMPAPARAASGCRICARAR